MNYVIIAFAQIFLFFKFGKQLCQKLVLVTFISKIIAQMACNNSTSTAQRGSFVAHPTLPHSSPGTHSNHWLSINFIPANSWERASSVSDYSECHVSISPSVNPSAFPIALHWAAQGLSLQCGLCYVSCRTVSVESHLIFCPNASQRPGNFFLFFPGNSALSLQF